MKKLIFLFLFAASLFAQDFGIIEKPSKWTDNGTSLTPRYPRSLKLSATAGTTPYGVIYKDGNRFIHDFNYGNNGTVTTVGYNTFVGEEAGNFTMGSTATATHEASYNTGIGRRALFSNTTGYQNSAMGMQSLYSNTTGYYNSAMGMQALYFNTTGDRNSAMGYASLFSNTTGYRNSAMGMQSLHSNTTGYQNSAMGMQSLYSNTTGNRNSAMGYASLFSNTTGYQNSAMGLNSLFSNTTGYQNSAMGMQALFSNTTGYQNSAMGYNSGRFIADGSTANATGNNSVFLGYDTRANADGQTNQIVIGASAIGAGSNSVVLGNSSIIKTLLRGNIGIGTMSPAKKLSISDGADTYSFDVASDKLQFYNDAGTPASLFTVDSTGNVTATGSITASSFIGSITQPKATAYLDSTATAITINTQYVWEQITGFTKNLEAGGVTFSGDTMYVSETGTYNLVFDFSMASATGGTTAQIGYSIDGAAPTNSHKAQRSFGVGATDYGIGVLHRTIDLTAGSYITLQVRNLSDTDNYSFLFGEWSVKKE